MRKFTKEELEFVKDCLKNKIPKNRFIRSVLHTDCRVFDRMCLEEGFEYPKFRKNKIWDNPFENLEDQDVQYWLGWLATDGYVGTTIEKRCTLRLQERDIDVIEKFNKFLGGNLTISRCMHHKKYAQVGISFRNEKIVLFLQSLGFNNHKTFEFDPKFPITWHYIRGCFEGDGYLRWGKTCEFSICGGCEKHLLKIKSFLEQCGINVKWYIKNKDKPYPIYYICVGHKKDIIQVLDNIYKDANTFMNRKYNLARSISNNTWKSLKFGEPASGIPSQA